MVSTSFPKLLLSLAYCGFAAAANSYTTTTSSSSSQVSFSEWRQTKYYKEACEKSFLPSSSLSGSGNSVSVSSGSSSTTGEFTAGTIGSTSTSSGSSDDALAVEEERYNQALTVIAELQKAHPYATFSVNTPFALMTEAEFVAYVNRNGANPALLPTGNSSSLSTASASSSVSTSGDGGPKTGDTDSSGTSTTSTTSGSGSSDEVVVDWETAGCVTAVKDQGECGACWAFSATAAMESGYCVVSGQASLPSLSDQELISCDVDGESDGCSGGYAAYTMEWVADSRSGKMCTLDSYPFTSTDGTSTSTCSDSTCTEVYIGVTGYESIRNDVDALEEMVTQRPVSVFLYSGSSAFQYYSGGILTGDSCAETGSHSALAVGYGTSGGVKYWRLKNQWGTSWGEEGYVRIERRYSGNTDGACGVEYYATYPTFDSSVISNSTTTTPTTTTATPTTTTATPVTTTATPTATTATPATTTATPATTTATPATTTATPASTTETPATTTATPATTTATPATTTATPASTTEAPATTTATPATTTATPATTTATQTSTPATTTAAPASTTETPATTTATPSTTTATPASTTATPATTTATPASTTETPATTTATPASTTETPVTTTATPATTTATPASTTETPATTTATPSTTTATPAAPATTTASPVATTSSSASAAGSNFYQSSPTASTSGSSLLLGSADDGSLDQCGNLDEGVDYLGNDLFNVSIASVGDCCALCQETDGCNAFTFTTWEDGHCWLKSRAGLVIPNAMAVSSSLFDISNCTQERVPAEVGYDYPGNDLREEDAESADACYDLCAEDDDCHAYSWTSAYGGVCYLKTKKVPAAEFKHQCVSEIVSAIVYKCSAVQLSTDFEGDDLSNTLARSPEACCAHCHHTDGCAAFSWNDFNGGTCWLKSAVSSATHKGSVVSATL